MKAVILAGGLGTRLGEETDLKPKPLVDIGGRPILWHIMKHYGHFGFNEFFIALGYRGEDIKRFFMDYSSFNGNMTINLASGELERHHGYADDWLVNLMDTGLQTSTGGRIKRCEPYLKDETFMATYGDGVSDVDLQELLRFHRSRKR